VSERKPFILVEKKRVAKRLGVKRVVEIRVADLGRPTTIGDWLDAFVAAVSPPAAAENEPPPPE